MKNELENIDKLFKKTFDGFEADVDPSVWTNVQSSIGSSVASTAAAAAGKSVALKIIAGVVAVGALATGTYFVTENTTSEEVEIAVNSPLQEVVIKERNTELAETKEEQVVNHVVAEELEEIKKKTTAESIKSIVVENAEEVPSFAKDKKAETANDVVSAGNASETSAITVSSTTSNKEEKPATIETKEVKELLARISSDKQSGKAPLDVEFDVEGENIVSYSWDFKDGSKASNNSNPLHTFNTPGTYNVVLTIVDENANSKQIPYQIKVERNNVGFLNREKVPRVITPNGDGIRDVIRIEGENIKEFNALVLSSATGKVIYKWNSLDGFWDGKNMEGDKVPNGTYYIQVTAVGEDGNPLDPIRQSVTLF